jgi:hypothetical protein
VILIIVVGNIAVARRRTVQSAYSHKKFTPRYARAGLETYAHFRKGINHYAQVSRAIPYRHAPRDDRVLLGFRWGILYDVWR